VSAYSSGGGSTTIDMNDMLLAPPPANTGRGRASSMTVATSLGPARRGAAGPSSPTTAGNSAYPQTLAGASKASGQRDLGYRLATPPPSLPGSQSLLASPSHSTLGPADRVCINGGSAACSSGCRVGSRRCGSALVVRCSTR